MIWLTFSRIGGWLLLFAAILAALYLLGVYLYTFQPKNRYGQFVSLFMTENFRRRLLKEQRRETEEVNLAIERLDDERLIENLWPEHMMEFETVPYRIILIAEGYELRSFTGSVEGLQRHGATFFVAVGVNADNNHLVIYGMRLQDQGPIERLVLEPRTDAVAEALLVDIQDFQGDYIRGDQQPLPCPVRGIEGTCILRDLAWTDIDGEERSPSTPTDYWFGKYVTQSSSQRMSTTLFELPDGTFLVFVKWKSGRNAETSYVYNARRLSEVVGLINIYPAREGRVV